MTTTRFIITNMRPGTMLLLTKNEDMDDVLFHGVVEGNREEIDVYPSYILNIIATHPGMKTFRHAHIHPESFCEDPYVMQQVQDGDGVVHDRPVLTGKRAIQL